MIYKSSNNGRHPVTMTFTLLHYTSPNYTSLYLSTLPFLSFKLHPTTLHYPFIWLNPISFPTAPLHLTSLHFNYIPSWKGKAWCGLD